MALTGARPLLVYDGSCGVCRGTVALLRRIGMERSADMRPFADVDGALQDRLLDAGFQNSVGLVDRATGAIRTGVDGFAWLLEQDGRRGVARALRTPWIHGPLVALYTFVAANRRVLAPPRANEPRCVECDPDPRPTFQWALVLLLAAASSAIVAGAAERLLPGDASRAWLATAAWVALHALFGVAGIARGPRGAALVRLGHAAMALLLGAACLLPAVALAPWLAGRARTAAGIASAAAATVVAAVALQRRWRTITPSGSTR